MSLAELIAENLGSDEIEDPVDWTQRRLGEAMYGKQRDIARSVVENRRTAVHSSFDTGKSWLSSRLCAWWLSTHPPGSARVVTTATTYAQVRAILWQEIGRAHRKGKLMGRVTQTEWWSGPELLGFGRRPRDWDPSAMTGIHAEFVLVIIDEASGVPRSIWEAVDGLITNEGSRILAIGNPWESGSRFHEVCSPASGWNTVHISAYDTPAFTKEDVPPEMLKVLVSPVWVDEIEQGYGRESAVWQTRVLGLFPDEADDQLIPMAWVRHCVDNEIEPPPIRPDLGVDVARYGNDETVIVSNCGGHIEIVDTFRKKPTTYTSGRVIDLMRSIPAQIAKVDDDGIGGAVTDNLREQGAQVLPVSNGGRPMDPTKFVNARSENWWRLRKLMEAEALDLPDDEHLIAQLTSIKYSLDSKGRIVVESKDDMRKRGVRSPDRADALLYALWASGGTTGGVAPIGSKKGHDPTRG